MFYTQERVILSIHSFLCLKLCFGMCNQFNITVIFMWTIEKMVQRGVFRRRSRSCFVYYATSAFEFVTIRKGA